MKSRPHGHALSISPSERFATGCIATLTDGEQTISQHFTGIGRDSTEAVADFCDRHGFRVVCLSTPATICRDLKGNRQVDLPRRAAGIRPVALRTPEKDMLSRIGRRDLLV